MNKKITLKRKKEVSLKRLHPWVFSGAVAKQDPGIEDGDIVDIYTSDNQFLAVGHYQDASIKVRVFSFEPTSGDVTFWADKFQHAYDVRKNLGFINNSSTNCYRLIHAEGDGCPGLVIDIFDQTAIIQCHSIGMHKQVANLANALSGVFGERLTCIYDKSSNTLPAKYASTMRDQSLKDTVNETITVLENGHQFLINYQTGQKTGFFLDQRDNRQLVGQYARGKNVLNSFCYTGGFSIYALGAGAALVHSVDASSKAIDLCNKNVGVNYPSKKDKHEGYAQDVLKFFKDTTTSYDLIILDPPAFAKKLSKTSQRCTRVQTY